LASDQRIFRQRLFPAEENLMKTNRVMYVCALLTAVTALTMQAYSQQKTERGASHNIVRFGDLKWTPIIKGCELAGVSGDPDAEGAPFVIRIRCVDGAKIPAHWHPTDENVTVLKGTFLVGAGETFDEAKMETMNVGNFLAVPKEMRHFAMSKGETIVQVHGAGPFKVNWVNPAEVIPPDAPAAKPKS
jgi:quercetin dioxygenase-like cupin family protein